MRSARGCPGVPWGMFGSTHLDETRYPLAMRWWLAGIWAVILAKCALVWWAMVHWSVPMHPAWIVLPTLLFALLATGVWLVARDD